VLQYLIPGEDGVCKFCSGSIEDTGGIFPPGRNITWGWGCKNFFIYKVKYLKNEINVWVKTPFLI